MSKTIFLQAIMNGLMLGLFYVAVASGLTLVFSIMRVINFAHGEFVMWGAYITYLMNRILGFNFLLSMVICMIVMGVVSVGFEKYFFRPVRKSEHGTVIMAFGISIVLQNIALFIWGPLDMGIKLPFGGILRLFGITLSVERLAVIVVCCVLIAGLYLFVQFTKIGCSFRAVSQDHEAAALQGINIERVYPLAFAIGGCIAGAAGSLVGALFSINPWMGMTPLLKGLIAIILGGLGSLPGTILGGIVLGIAESFGGIYFGAAFQDMLGFIIIMLVLITKPSGLFGEKEG